MIKVNGKELDYSLFPNLEMLVDTKCFESVSSGEKIEIEYQFSGNESLLHLYFVLSHIKMHFPECSVNLVIAYMPYSRMDRSQNGSCFTLAHTASLIASALKDGDSVSIVEPHSEETLKQFEACGCKSVRALEAIPGLAKSLIDYLEVDVVCYPDKGARLRYAQASFDKPVVHCEKKRDFDTGNIIGLDLVGAVDLTERIVLIVDDLCSKGGTFFHTANRLREAGARAVFLLVCHMEPNVVNGELVKDSSPVNHVYCTDTMIGAESLGQSRITTFPWKDFSGVSSFC